jgi:hypothetical protein
MERMASLMCPAIEPWEEHLFFWPDLRVVVFYLQVLKPSRTGEVLPNFLSNYVALV